MMRLKKVPKGTLILVGLAALAYYKYSKLSEEQKNNLLVSLKEKIKRIYEEYVPTSVKKLFANEEYFIYDDDFEEHSDYLF